MTGLLITGVMTALTVLSGATMQPVTLQDLPTSCIQATDECSNMCNRTPGQDVRACTKMACVTEQDAVCLATTNDEDLTQLPTMCTMQYDPVCAEKQVQCVTTPCDPIRQTYGNSCMAAADNATIISQGECGTDLIVGGDKDEHGCIGSAGYVWSEDAQQCVRPWEQEQTIVWAYNLGITKHNSYDAFNWNALVTREQAAKMIMTAIDASGIEEWTIKQPEGSCIWTDADSIDSSLLPMVTRSCMKGLFKGSNNIFMPKAYLTDTDTMTVITRAAQYIPALADVMMRSKFAVTDKPLTRGELLTRLQGLIASIQGSVEPTQPEVDFAQLQNNLDAARTLWNSKKLSTYSLIQTRSCFCMEDYTRAMMYNVVNGIINTGSLVYADDDTKVTIETQLNTVEQAFDMIQEAIDSKVANLTVQYDGLFGYPTSIAIDRDFMIADEEMYYSFKLITDTTQILSGKYQLLSHNDVVVYNTGITLSFTPTHMYAKICNNLSATYESIDSTIEFGPMISTQMYCMDDELMNIESVWGSMITGQYQHMSGGLLSIVSPTVTTLWKKLPQ